MFPTVQYTLRARLNISSYTAVLLVAGGKPSALWNHLSSSSSWSAAPSPTLACVPPSAAASAHGLAVKGRGEFFQTHNRMSQLQVLLLLTNEVDRHSFLFF